MQFAQNFATLHAASVQVALGARFSMEAVGKRVSPNGLSGIVPAALHALLKHRLEMYPTSWENLDRAYRVLQKPGDKPESTSRLSNGKEAFWLQKNNWLADILKAANQELPTVDMTDIDGFAKIVANASTFTTTEAWDCGLNGSLRVEKIARADVPNGVANAFAALTTLQMANTTVDPGVADAILDHQSPRKLRTDRLLPPEIF